MSRALAELLKMVAEGRISPAEGVVLLRAMAQGYPEELGLAGGPRPEGAEVGRPGGQATGDEEASGTAAGTVGAGPTGAPPGGRRPAAGMVADRGADGGIDVAVGGGPDIRAGTDHDRELGGPPLQLQGGQSIELSEDAILRIETPARSQALEDGMTSVAVRGLPASRLVLVRGSGVEIRRTGKELLLTWPRGLLLLEIPSRLRALEIRHLGGGVGVSGYGGPFTIEDVEGPLTVHEPRSPFRVRGVRGPVRIQGLALRDGISTIAQVGAEVEVEAGRDAAVTIRADSSEGGVAFGDEAAGLDGAGPRRRGVWRVGAGTAQLEISGVRGRILLQRASGPSEQP